MKLLPLVGTFEHAAADVGNRQEALDRNAAVAKSSINELKQKIADARENTNR